jgi:hypothetical protein
MTLSLPSLARPRPLVWRQIHWPAELTIEQAESLLRQVGTDQQIPLMALEVEGTAGSITHRLGLPSSTVDRIKHLMESLAPGSAVTKADDRQPLSEFFRIVLTTRHRPLHSTDPERATRALLAALTSTRRNETVVLQWLLGPGRAPRTVHASEPVSPEWWRALGSGTSAVDPEQRRALELKRGSHAFACAGRVGISTPTPERTRALAVQILAALRTSEAPGIGVKLVKDRSDRFNNPTPPWFWPNTLNVSELVGLLGWPLGDKSLPGISRDQSRWLRPDPRVRSRTRVLGAPTAPGEHGGIGLSVDDARQHLHILGPTGTGKSTLLSSLALADIAAGRSVVVIEPKGDMIADILARIPAKRIDDVVVIDPSEAQLPIGLNPLVARGRSSELIADQV